MSKFRERAAEVKAAGEEARGDFTPNGVPKRMYQWWLENSPSAKATEISTGQRRENFCHFWRVVVIWVPLLWLADKILNPLLDAAERVNPKYALVGVAVLVAGIAALIATSTGTWMEVLIVMAWILGIAAAMLAIAALFYCLDKYTEKGVEILLGTVLGLLILTAAIAGFIEVGWTLILWILLVLAIVVVFFGGAIFIGTVIEHLRADSRKRATDAEEAAWERYTNGEGPHPYAREPKQPGKVLLFFRGVGDFLTLAAQVVRVNKWKICPLVEVDVPPRKVGVPAEGEGW